MNNKWYKKPEMIVAFSVLLISVVTVVIGVYSAYIDIKNNQSTTEVNKSSPVKYAGLLSNAVDVNLWIIV